METNTVLPDTQGAANKRWTDMPLLALGFRPFYLLAALFAVLAVPLWMAVYAGLLPLDGYLSGVAWHNHEMFFGFAAAVITGFLLTAVRNWTGLPTLDGGALAALALLWLSGRATALTGPGIFAAVVDAAFLPALTVAIALPILKSRDERNVKILFVVGGLAAVNVIYHLAQLQLVPATWTARATAIALGVITLLMAIVGGRVIPAFTANAVRGANPRSSVLVEIVAIGSLIVILVAEVLSAWAPLNRPAWVVLLAVAALAHGWRLLLWQPWRTRHNALLAMLPVAYAWIPLAIALRALAQAGLLPPAAATHALTIGAMASLMLAMMMRSTLGHTGRPLVAGPVERLAFVLVQLAAVVRVLGVAVPVLPYREAVVLSGVLWTLAFGAFVVRYWPLLTRPRTDGKPG